MTKIFAALMSTCMLFAANTAIAMDAMKKGDTMAKDSMMKKDMTMQECKDHMAMSKKDGKKKDEMMIKKDAMCADMMKKDTMGKDSMMKKDDMAGPMKK